MGSNLTVVEGGGEHERRRVPRLTLTSEQFKLMPVGRIYSVVDLSTGGMAIRILDPQDLRSFTLGADLQGVLNLRREKYRLSLKVRHVGRDLVGCEFTDLADDVRVALEKALSPRELGKELKPFPHQDALTIWYYGSGGTNLILRRGIDGKLRSATLFILGIYAIWDEEKGVSTGSVGSTFEPSETRGAVRFETLDMTPDSSPDLTKMNIAKQLILGSNLPTDVKDQCARQFK